MAEGFAESKTNSLPRRAQFNGEEIEDIVAPGEVEHGIRGLIPIENCANVAIPCRCFWASFVLDGDGLHASIDVNFRDCVVVLDCCVLKNQVARGDFKFALPGAKDASGCQRDPNVDQFKRMRDLRWMENLFRCARQR